MELEQIVSEYKRLQACIDEIEQIDKPLANKANSAKVILALQSQNYWLTLMIDKAPTDKVKEAAIEKLAANQQYISAIKKNRE